MGELFSVVNMRFGCEVCERELVVVILLIVFFFVFLLSCVCIVVFVEL